VDAATHPELGAELIRQAEDKSGVQAALGLPASQRSTQTGPKSLTRPAME
jgi:hypothetical protein